MIKQTSNKAVDYSYDKENYLVGATIQKGNSVTIESYTYDYEGNRLQKPLMKVKQMVNDAAKNAGVDRNAFGEYIHEVKAELNMKANQNFSYKELLELAEELKRVLGE